MYKLFIQIASLNAQLYAQIPFLQIQLYKKIPSPETRIRHIVLIDVRIKSSSSTVSLAEMQFY